MICTSYLITTTIRVVPFVVVVPVLPPPILREDFHTWTTVRLGSTE